MDSGTWLTAGVGLGSAVIGGALGLAGVWVQQRSSAKGERAAARRAAYADLLAYSALLIYSAESLHATMAHRSGLAEGVGIATRTRQPRDLLDIHTFVRPDLEPLHRAWAAVWAIGSPGAVRLANDLIYEATAVMEAKTRRGAARRPLHRFLLGEAWTAEQEAEAEAAVRRLADVRREFGELARRELGSEVAELFALPAVASTDPSGHS